MPVSARRSGVIARGIKWCWRHPSIAASLLVAGSVAVLAALLALRARDATERLQPVVVERDEVEARADAIASDLETAQEAVEAATQLEQDQILEAALVAAMQGDAPNAHAATHAAEDRGMSPRSG